MKSILGGKKKSLIRNNEITQKLVDQSKNNKNDVELQKPKFKRDTQAEHKAMLSRNKSSDVEQNIEQNNEVKNSVDTPAVEIKEGYQWDFCILVANPDFLGDKSDRDTVVSAIDEHKMHHEEILERLHLGGLDTYQFYSGDNDEIFIKIHASLERLQHHAEQIGFRMLLDEHYLEQHVDDPSNRIADNPDLTRLSPYEFIHSKYDTGE
jgi:hypothetical protein